MSALELEGVYAGYGGGDVLQGVDLALEPGSVTCIVGPNGAGKSTVLRVVSGLLRPREGSVRFSGESIGGSDPAEILERGIVQVPQSQGLFPNLTVRENVLMGAYVLRRQRRLVRDVERVELVVPERAPGRRQPREDEAGDGAADENPALQAGRCRARCGHGGAR